jgi:Mg2+ and Co2+ transporter CorA
MTEFIDFADEREPEAVSEQYLARLAEYRRRLTALRASLFQLNDLIDRVGAVQGAPSQTHH